MILKRKPRKRPKVFEQFSAKNISTSILTALKKAAEVFSLELVKETAKFLVYLILLYFGLKH